MVEYFGEQLSGFAFTENGWVQSYGSRCVKPPIIYGDVSRPNAMTVFWSTYAQSLTARPMKGMLTGPVTILNWSFVRNDQPRWVIFSQVNFFSEHYMYYTSLFLSTPLGDPYLEQLCMVDSFYFGA